MPRVPWRWLLLAACILALLGTAHWYTTVREAESVRGSILATYEGRLAPVVRRYRGFRHKIEAWILSAAEGGEPRSYADPRLQIAPLHNGDGVYLRVPAREATDEEAIARAAKSMRADSIGRCLGIAPISLRGFYQGGGFLMPRWIQEIEAEDDVARLRVLRDVFVRRVEEQIPGLMHAMDAQYFLLALERGPSRINDPVDVYMWDLRQDRMLLSVRTRSTGLLIPARIALPGVPRAPRVRPQHHAQLAGDCSIAAQIKEVTGEPALTFGSHMPEQEPAAAPTAP